MKRTGPLVFSPSQPPRMPASPAHRIGSDEEAIATARKVAAVLAPGAAARDRERRYGLSELDLFSQSGLWALPIPRTHGGAGVSFATLGQVFAIIAEADPSIAQLAQGHNSLTYLIGRVADETQKQHFWRLILDGYRIGNVAAEIGVPAGSPLATRLEPDGEGYRLSGRKFFCTGALLSHLVAVYAADENDDLTICLIASDTPGLHLEDDWQGLGQRTTASGSAVLSQVKVARHEILAAGKVMATTPQTAVTHVSHAGIDLGIAQAALNDTLAYLREHLGGRSADPHILEAIGRMSMRCHAAEGLLERAGRLLDDAAYIPASPMHAAAQSAVFEAKIAAAEAAVDNGNLLFELCGTRSTLPPHHFDRHWRNARTHSLHDPIYRRAREIGEYRLACGPTGGSIA